MKNERGGFFAVDRSIWSEVCNVGMNEAVTYLVLAQGTGADNRSTSWSAGALHRYVGITWERGCMAIESLVKLGFLRHAEKHTRSRPRYELVAWCEKGRLKVGADADISVFDPARVIDKVTYEN